MLDYRSILIIVVYWAYITNQISLIMKTFIKSLIDYTKFKVTNNNDEQIIRRQLLTLDRQRLQLQSDLKLINHTINDLKLLLTKKEQTLGSIINKVGETKLKCTGKVRVVYQTLYHEKSSISFRNIQTLTGFKKETVSAILSKAVSKGLVIRVGRGVYQITKSGIELFENSHG